MSQDLENQQFENQEIENQQPTRPKKKGNLKRMMSNNFIHKIKECNSMDRYMVIELFVFLFSFLFLVADDKVDDIQSRSSPVELDVMSDGLAHKKWNFYFNGFLMIDFFFRMLSLKVESIDPKYWNHTLHCVFPLAMWMLAAYYTFDDVFEKEATGTLNILLFIAMNIGVIFVILSKYISISAEKIKEKIKGCFKKKEQQNNQPIVVEPEEEKPEDENLR